MVPPTSSCSTAHSQGTGGVWEDHRQSKKKSFSHRTNKSFSSDISVGMGIVKNLAVPVPLLISLIDSVPYRFSSSYIVQMALVAVTL